MDSGNDFIYLEHILESIIKIEKYALNISFDEFMYNDLIQDAVIRNFQAIGETAKVL